MTERLTELAKDDPDFARQQIEKMIESGEIERWHGEELLRMRYPEKKEKARMDDLKVYVIDIDGTLADLTHRLHFIQTEPKDWDAFFAACADDAPIQDVIDVVRSLFQQNPRPRFVYLTGRSDAVRRETQEWLFNKHFLPQGDVIMRKDGDHRPDTTTKRELMDALLADGFRVAGVFEDRPSMCRLWREMGFTVFQLKHEEF